MLFAKQDHMPSEISERRFYPFEAIENACQFAVEGLLGDIAASVKWIERVRETIVQCGQPRNFLRDPLL